jgi:anaerobic glycerol-3-phosphate dehydrogenase
MKILIDNNPLQEQIPLPKSFPEFCEQIMEILLARNLSIGSCEFDGTVVSSLEEAHDLFQNSEICKIASIPLAVALEAALSHKCADARRLEAECEELVTQALLGEPTEIAMRWQAICEEIKAQIGFLPRLSGLLTDAQVNQLVDRQFKDLGKVMHALHAAFNNADTLEISDSIELRLLPWLRQLRSLMENCLQLVKTLHR